MRQRCNKEEQKRSPCLLFALFPATQCEWFPGRGNGSVFTVGYGFPFTAGTVGGIYRRLAHHRPPIQLRRSLSQISSSALVTSITLHRARCSLQTVCSRCLLGFTNIAAGRVVIQASSIMVCTWLPLVSVSSDVVNNGIIANLKIDLNCEIVFLSLFLLPVCDYTLSSIWFGSSFYYYSTVNSIETLFSSWLTFSPFCRKSNKT